MATRKDCYAMRSALQNLFLSAIQLQNELPHAAAVLAGTHIVRLNPSEQNMRAERPQRIFILTVRQCKIKLDINYENPICNSLIAQFKCEVLHDITHRWSSEGTETPISSLQHAHTTQTTMCKCGCQWPKSNLTLWWYAISKNHLWVLLTFMFCSQRLPFIVWLLSGVPIAHQSSFRSSQALWDLLSMTEVMT